MSVVVKTLDETERQQMEAQADRIADTPKPHVDVHSGREFVFVAHFDGTLNDKDNLKKGERQTNVANLHELMEPHAENNENFVSHYEPGVGTQNSGLVRAWKAAISPTADMRRTANEAYERFRHDASDWLREHPDADPATSLKVMATGFSRGGVTMAMFSQLLYERGLTDYKNEHGEVDPGNGKILVPPGVLGLSGGIVYDPVSKGYKGNAAFSPTSRNITEVQATSEYRRWFKDVNHDADPNVTTVEVMGNHGNIGGGHDDQGIAAKIMESSREWFDLTGVPESPIPAHMRYRADQAVNIYEERDLPGMTPIAKLAGNKFVRSAAVALAGGGVIKPTEMLIPRTTELLARKADYPRTHDPRDGLDAPRQQQPSARHQAQMGDGWQRFESVNSMVWSKDAPDQNASGLTHAVLVERNPRGRNNDRIDLHLSHEDGTLRHQQTSIAGGRRMQRMGTEIRQRLDQAFNQPIPVAERQMRESLERREQVSSKALDQKVESRLEQRLNRDAQERHADQPGPAAPSASRSVPAAEREAVSARRKEISHAFKTDPDTALAQYPDDPRIEKAKATLEAVSARYAGSSRGAALTKRMHHYLTNRLAQGTAIPNSRQAFGLINQAMGRGGIGD